MSVRPASSNAAAKSQSWPALPIAEWQPTRDTLHMWTQIVGKIRMDLTPAVNHWWHVPLYIGARGLTTGVIPYGPRAFEMTFDFIEHALIVQSSDAQQRRIELISQTVAEFYNRVMKTMDELGLPCRVWRMPVEVPAPIPFDEDTVHATYDREYVERFWRALLSLQPVFLEFRGRFLGKSSPLHFFWGSFDLALTRFSGKKAPVRDGVDSITREAYSHEVISAGWWTGSGSLTGPAFYAYAAPAPEGYYESADVKKPGLYSEEFKEFILLYDEVRTADNPERVLMDFLQQTYEAGARLGRWDRESLEKDHANLAA